MKDLKAFNLYFHRPASELIFLHPTLHRQLHMKGRFVSKETRIKSSLARIGRKASLESRKKMSISAKKRPCNRKGCKHTEESKLKMSLAAKGRPAAFKGHKHTEEAKQKNRLAHIGKKRCIVDGKIRFI